MPKLFEVVTEFIGDENEIITQREYVTADNNSMKLVVDHFTQHCYEYDKELKRVTEVATITQHIKEE